MWTRKNLFPTLAVVLLIAIVATLATVVRAQSGSDMKASEGSATKVEEGSASSDTIATVNGTAIEKVAFDREMARVSQQMATIGRPIPHEQMAQLKTDIVDNLIDGELLYQESQKENIVVDDATVDEHIATLKKQFPSEEKFKETIQGMNISEDEIRTDYKRGRSIELLLEGKVVKDVSLPDGAAKIYYDENPTFFKQPGQVQASHILIKVEAGADEAVKAEARKQIEDIQQKIKDGGDFAELAKEFSEGPSNVNGGDLGLFGRGQMVPPFEEAAFAMEPGQVSDVVETRFGYHLIKLADKKDDSTAPFEDVEERLMQYLKQQETQKQVGAYIETLKESATVERFPVQ
jgi:peptidyl-prolyl cis-trans isomerase C